MTPDLLLGLIGDNIAASRSPFLHVLAGRQNGLRVQYDRLVPPVLGKEFADVFAGAAAGGYHGVNVTYPYKEQVVAHVSVPDPLVRAVGAVNTVIFGADGPTGHNTDYSGFIAAYRGLRGDAPVGAVLMIGAGGVGRAVAFGLVALGVRDLRLVDRDHTKASALAADLQRAAPELAVQVAQCAETAAAGAQGVVNCTPVGMVGYEGTPLARDALAGAAWVFDAVYTPVETQFLRDARAQGAQVVSGWELFFWQGVHAWALFSNGLGLDLARLRADLLAPAEGVV